MSNDVGSIYGYSLEVTADKNENIIHLRERVHGRVYENYINLKEEKVRAALMELGWAPPVPPLQEQDTED